MLGSCQPNESLKKKGSFEIGLNSQFEWECKTNRLAGRTMNNDHA